MFLSKKEALGRGALAVTLLLGASACGSSQPENKEDSRISSCWYDETNVEPTYVPGKAGYSPTTDPSKVAAYQEAHLSSPDDVWGIGTLLCTLTVDKNWDGSTNKTKQVFTQDGLKIALQMQSELANS